MIGDELAYNTATRTDTIRGQVTLRSRNGFKGEAADVRIQILEAGKEGETRLIMEPLAGEKECSRR